MEKSKVSWLQLHWRVCVQLLSYSTTPVEQQGRQQAASQVSPSQQMQGNAIDQVSQSVAKQHDRSNGVDA